MAKAKKFMVVGALDTPAERKGKGHQFATNDSDFEGEVRAPLFRNLTHNLKPVTLSSTHISLYSPIRRLSSRWLPGSKPSRHRAVRATTAMRRACPRSARHRQPRPPPTAHRPPPTAHRTPRTAHRPPPTAHRAPRTTHRPPPTAHRPPPHRRQPKCFRSSTVTPSTKSASAWFLRS